MTDALRRAAQYRKKPVVITAEQFFPDRVPWPEGVMVHPLPLKWRIDTLEGGHVVTPGDWIIIGVKGERYPCKPDIFALTYEPMLAAPAAEREESDIDLPCPNCDEMTKQRDHYLKVVAELRAEVSLLKAERSQAAQEQCP